MQPEQVAHGLGKLLVAGHDEADAGIGAGLRSAGVRVAGQEREQPELWSGRADEDGNALNCIPDPALGHDSCSYRTTSNIFKGGPHNRRASVTSQPSIALSPKKAADTSKVAKTAKKATKALKSPQ